MRRVPHVIACLFIITACNSTPDLDSLCKDSYELERKIAAARKAGGDDRAAVAAWKKLDEQLRRYPQDQVYHAMQRVTGVGR